MSILSCFRSDFINYLYDNNLKIETYENSYSGWWNFLRKCDGVGITQMHYAFNKEKKLLTIRWDELGKKLSPFIILYFIFSFSSDLDEMYIFYTNNKSIKFICDCFLCISNNKKCPLCKSDKPISKIIKMYDPEYRNDSYSEKFRSLIKNDMNHLIKFSYFPISFIRNYMDKHNIRLYSQEYMDSNNNSIYGYTGKAEFTFFDNTLCIEVSKYKKHKILKLIVFHLISSYSTHSTIPSHMKIMIKLNRNYKNHCHLQKKFIKNGFSVASNEDLLLFRNKLNVLENRTPIILLSTYKNILPYIIHEWNHMKI